MSGLSLEATRAGTLAQARRPRGRAGRFTRAAPAVAALAALLLAPAALSAAAAGAASPDADVAAEELIYRWHLQGVVGLMARIFLPGKGEGRLVTSPVEGGLETRLHVTSRKADTDEFWTYGSRIEDGGKAPSLVWNASRFRGRDKRREAAVEEPGVVDIPSAIHLLRREAPSAGQRLRLWADGKIYPVTVSPRRLVQRKVAGRRIEVAHYSVRSRKVAGERTWKGRLDLWLTTDERALPVEILMRRSGGKLHLELDPAAAATAARADPM